MSNGIARATSSMNTSDEFVPIGRRGNYNYDPNARVRVNHRDLILTGAELAARRAILGDSADDDSSDSDDSDETSDDDPHPRSRTPIMVLDVDLNASSRVVNLDEYEQFHDQGYDNFQQTDFTENVELEVSINFDEDDNAQQVHFVEHENHVGQFGVEENGYSAEDESD